MRLLVMLFTCVVSQACCCQEIITVSRTPLQDGGIAEVITNNSSIAVTSIDLHIRCNQRGEMRFYIDSLLSSTGNTSISPRSSHTVRIPSEYGKCGVGELAVLFADGSSFGSSEAVKSLHTRRQAYTDELTLLRPIIRDTADGIQSSASFREKIEARHNTVTHDVSRDFDEKIGRTFALHSTVKQFFTESQSDFPSTTSFSMEYHDGDTSSSADSHHRAIHTIKWLNARQEALQKAESNGL